MDQPTFADLEYQGKKRKTRREIFLERMDGLIPWQKLEERIRPFYSKAGKGRRPYPLAVMLRIHCVQLFYNLSDPGMEDLLYEAESVRRFAGLSLAEALPDETTILNFRHLLERHELGKGLFEEINRHLEAQGLRLREGTIVDASIIEASSSTKNGGGNSFCPRSGRGCATCGTRAGSASPHTSVEFPYRRVPLRRGTPCGSVEKVRRSEYRGEVEWTYT